MQPRGAYRASCTTETGSESSNPVFSAANCRCRVAGIGGRIENDATLGLESQICACPLEPTKVTPHEQARLGAATYDQRKTCTIKAAGTTRQHVAAPPIAVAGRLGVGPGECIPLVGADSRIEISTRREGVQPRYVLARISHTCVASSARSGMHSRVIDPY